MRDVRIKVGKNQDQEVMKLSNIARFLLNITLHLTALIIIGAAFWPIANWYFSHRPILGVDFFNTVTHVRFLSQTFNLPMWAFRYFWFGGSPVYTDFSIGWYYPIAFLAKFIPIISSVKTTMMVSFLLFLTFTYFAVQRLSKHHIFSAAVTILVAFSPNLYGSLTWGGSLPYFANQLFFPLVLWTLASFLDTGKRKWFWATILVTGLSFLGHAMNAGTFVFTSAAMLLFLGQRKQKTGFKLRIKDLVLFFIGLVAVSYRVSYSIFRGIIESLLGGSFFNPFAIQQSKVQFSGEGLSVVGDSGQISWERSQFEVLFSNTNQWLFALVGFCLALWLVALVMEREKKRSLRVLPWALLAGYSILHVFANSYGFPFLQQGWYRAFWHFPVTLAVFIAAIVGYSLDVFHRNSKTLGRIISIVLVVAVVGLLGLVYQSDDLGKTLAVVDEKSSPSSSYPEAISLVRDDMELDELKSELVPDWLDPGDRNWRLYESDAQVNIWWNGIFDMPLVRGYIDPFVGTDRMGQIFLTDQSVGSDGLVENFDYPEQVAKNMALYYIDWNAMRYFEGGHVSISDNKVPSSYLADAIEEQATAETVGLYRLYETESGKPEIMDIPQYLKYYRFKDDLVTPVLSISNAPAALCLCDWPQYESFLKVLSMNGIHSQYLVTAYSEDKIDTFSLEDFANFDLLVLSSYSYRNSDKVFGNLTKYVSGGGKVFIDTGGETPDSENYQLSNFFPFGETERVGLGKEWDLTGIDGGEFSGVDFTKFSMPIYEDDDWKFSYPVGGVNGDVDVMLSQSGKPVLASWEMGEGSVIWSGMNLAYHIHVNTNIEESRFFIKLLESLISIEKHSVVYGKPNFESSREVSFESNNSGKGVLFKEQYYPGWDIKVNGKSAKAYKAGPAYPGFIYVPLDENGPVKASFIYWGRIRWYLMELFSLVAGIVLLDLSIFKGKFLGKKVVRLGRKFGKRVGGWWEKEEE